MGVTVADQNRANAIESLLKLEVDFAKLRDALFLERMAEVTSERQLIQDDAHPDLTYLYDHLTHKRKTRLDVAKRWLVRLQQEADLEKLARERIAWSQWTEQRATLKSGLLDEVNGKRRALEREKRVSDRGNRDGLCSSLQPCKRSRR